MKKAVVLFSGGLDSTTVLASLMRQEVECYPISFSYGQRHSLELEACKKIAAHFKVKEHKIVHLPNDLFGSSAFKTVFPATIKLAITLKADSLSNFQLPLRG